MQDYRLSTDEAKSINQAMELKMQEVDKVDLPGRQARLADDESARLRHGGAARGADRRGGST